MKNFFLTLTLFLLTPSYIFSQELVEEIIVTATKTEKTLQEVPVAVSVVTSDTIEKASIMDIFDLKSVIPSLDTRHCLLYTSPSPRD